MRVVVVLYVLILMAWSVLDFTGFKVWEGLLLLPLLPLGDWMIWDLTRKYRNGLM